MAPPAQPVHPESKDELASWHEKYHSFFELGMLYTMIAGLLNLLAVYDAYAGPAVDPPEEETEAERDSSRRRTKKSSGKTKWEAGKAAAGGG